MSDRSVDSKIQSSTKSYWLWFLVFLLAIQSVLLSMDHHPMFFLGDSKSYIWTAISGWLPPDRSFVYGYFIRLVAVYTQSLVSLVIVQVALLVAASSVMAHLLVRYFRVRLWIAFAVALLTSLEPLQLLFTRYVMTETLALFVFVLYSWAFLHYLENPRIKWLFLIHGLAVVLISIRFAYIPSTWVCAIILPILAFPAIAEKTRMVKRKKIGNLIAHIVISTLILFVLSSTYKHINGYFQHKPPAYSYEGGFSAMGFVLPILEPGDFADKTLGEQVLKGLPFSASDRHVRWAHRYYEGGAVSRLQKLEPDLIKADAIASQAVISAIAHRPHAFFRLGWLTSTDYFDPSRLQTSIKNLLGDRRLDLEFHDQLKTRFKYTSDQSSSLDLNSLSGQYVFRSRHWIQLLLFTPLGWGLLFLFTYDADRRRKNGIMGLSSLMLVGIALFLVENPTPRYLHTCAWLFLMMTGVGLNSLFNREQL
ncbi:MAG: hypothetical protein KJ630_09360 [Proteobacteria bacterium]|nr:hypothetical protein [Pseudomonadota bacterium]